MKSKIYTKTGDKGLTGLVGGDRVPKSDERIEIYGDLDELNSSLGMIVDYLDQLDQAIFLNLKDSKETILKIQNWVFDLSSILACESGKRKDFKIPEIESEDILFLERKIDEMDKQLTPLKNFILPGGSLLVSSVHMARTICRRAERRLVRYQLQDSEEIPDNPLIFLNRLSDFLFVFSRFCGKQQNVLERLWTPN